MIPTDKDVAEARAWLHVHGLGGISFGPLATLIARVRGEERERCRKLAEDYGCRFGMNAHISIAMSHLEKAILYSPATTEVQG